MHVVALRLFLCVLYCLALLCCSPDRLIFNYRGGEMVGLKLVCCYTCVATRFFFCIYSLVLPRLCCFYLNPYSTFLSECWVSLSMVCCCLYLCCVAVVCYFIFSCVASVMLVSSESINNLTERMLVFLKVVLLPYLFLCHFHCYCPPEPSCELLKGVLIPLKAVCWDTCLVLLVWLFL